VLFCGRRFADHTVPMTLGAMPNDRQQGVSWLPLSQARARKRQFLDIRLLSISPQSPLTIIFCSAILMSTLSYWHMW
jgi:hypothetical protein